MINSERPQENYGHFKNNFQSFKNPLEMSLGYAEKLQIHPLVLN